MYVGLLPNVLEDLPQFGVQIYVLIMYGKHDNVSIVSLIASSLSLTVGVLGRLLSLALVKAKSVKKSEEEFTELELN